MSQLRRLSYAGAVIVVCVGITISILPYLWPPESDLREIVMGVRKGVYLLIGIVFVLLGCLLGLAAWVAGRFDR